MGPQQTCNACCVWWSHHSLCYLWLVYILYDRVRLGVPPYTSMPKKYDVDSFTCMIRTKVSFLAKRDLSIVPSAWSVDGVETMIIQNHETRLREILSSRWKQSGNGRATFRVFPDVNLVQTNPNLGIGLHLGYFLKRHSFLKTFFVWKEHLWYKSILVWSTCQGLATGTVLIQFFRLLHHHRSNTNIDLNVKF